MKIRQITIVMGMLACLSNAVFAQGADSTSPGRLWGKSTRLPLSSIDVLWPPMGSQYSYSGGTCGGFIFGPPNGTINLVANDASGCSALGGCDTTKTLNSNGYIAIPPGGGGNGGAVMVYQNGKLVTSFLTASNCSPN